MQMSSRRVRVNVARFQMRSAAPQIQRFAPRRWHSLARGTIVDLFRCRDGKTRRWCGMRNCGAENTDFTRRGTSILACRLTYRRSGATGTWKKRRIRGIDPSGERLRCKVSRGPRKSLGLALERNIFVGDRAVAVGRSFFMLGYALVEAAGRLCASGFRAAVTAAAFATLTRSAEKHQFIDDD